MYNLEWHFHIKNTLKNNGRWNYVSFLRNGDVEQWVLGTFLNMQTFIHFMVFSPYFNEGNSKWRPRCFSFITRISFLESSLIYTFNDPTSQFNLTELLNRQSQLDFKFFFFFSWWFDMTYQQSIWTCSESFFLVL